MTFSDKVLELIQPGIKVLDLGAGNDWFAKRCLELQATVVAVDRVIPKELSPDIDWHQIDVKEFIEHLPSNETYDIIFSRNLIQFLEHSWVEETLIPTLVNHLRPNGILAIQTFYQDPEPAFERPLVSRYTSEQLRQFLSSLEILHLRQFSEHAPDMKGVLRTFFITNCIAQKK